MSDIPFELQNALLPQILPAIYLLIIAVSYEKAAFQVE